MPAVEDFDGFLKVLRPALKAGDYVLLVLYERGKHGASFKQIEGWVKPDMRGNLRRTLNRLVDDEAFVHSATDQFFLTKLGMAEVEKKRLHDIGA